jgi:glycosyltransferase involved in cell wall biosynthesis
LYLQTYLYADRDARNPKRILSKIQEYVEKTLLLKFSEGPRVEIMSAELPTRDMPRLYKNFDAFVLPTRGEGWGLPIIEAMAMG